MGFTEEQINRYARHILLPEVGGIGQEKLLASKVLVVGAGGLGSPLILYLAAAGVGTIGVIDDDVVDLSNLQRQVLHHTADIGSFQATEVIKELLNIGESLVGSFLIFDGLNAEVRKIKVNRDPGCPICGDEPTIKDLSIHE